jgi:hypothetical protein
MKEVKKKVLSLDSVWASRNKLHVEGNKLCDKGVKLRFAGYKLFKKGKKFHIVGYKMWTKGRKMWAEGSKLYAEGDKLWMKAIFKVYGNIKVKWASINECYLETGEVFKS